MIKKLIPICLMGCSFPKTTSGKNNIIFLYLIPNLKMFVFGETDGKLSKVNLILQMLYFSLNNAMFVRMYRKEADHNYHK
jgi:hypothetical protein